LEVLAAMPLEELFGLRVKVEAASLFRESDLKVGSAVAAIPEESWRSRGAQLTTDAISHLPGVIALPTFGGARGIAIRGYATELSVRGTATRIDGVPMNTFGGGTAQYTLPNFNLGTLDRIEMIRGPGSALYGSDAFHGVLSMKTFQSPRNVIQAEAEAGTLGRYHGFLRGSGGPRRGAGPGRARGSLAALRLLCG
jgi:iron complex outermembrane receptor protein